MAEIIISLLRLSHKKDWLLFDSSPLLLLSLFLSLCLFLSYHWVYGKSAAMSWGSPMEKPNWQEIEGCKQPHE